MFHGHSASPHAQMLRYGAWCVFMLLGVNVKDVSDLYYQLLKYDIDLHNNSAGHFDSAS